ncbi:MAG: hypothetical protein KKI14_02630, partial [Nanoarchaeota archaeon]|nr:hypothetical protein [Nanoarchaeota archaeon]
MRKGLVLPIAGIIMFVISVVAVYVLAQQDGNFTKEVIFKGEVTASNLNELEMIRKMLPMAMEATIERATFESAKDGYGKSSWGCVVATATCIATIPTTDEIKQNLINEIIKIKKPTIGNYNRDITWSIPVITITTGSDYLTYFKISGSFSFRLEDKIIKSKAESSVPISDTISSSYFKLYEVGKSIFVVNSDEYNILNRNAPAWWKIEQLKTTLISKSPSLNFLVEEVTNTELRITITDPISLVPCEPGESGCTNSMKPLSTVFKITIPARIIYDNK